MSRDKEKYTTVVVATELKKQLKLHAVKKNVNLVELTELAIKELLVKLDKSEKDNATH